MYCLVLLYLGSHLGPEYVCVKYSQLTLCPIISYISLIQKRGIHLQTSLLNFLMNCFVCFINTYSHINVETVVQLKPL